MSKPQDLPAGAEQLRVGVLLALLTYVVALAVPFGLGRALLQAVLDLGISGATLWFALIATDRRVRFEQAFGGLCGASAFINLAAAPLYLTRPELSAESGSSLGALPDFVLLVWGLSLLAHIIRHTFEIKMALSVFISFIYFLLLMSFMSAIIAVPDSSAHSSLSRSTSLPIQASKEVLTMSGTQAFKVVTSTTRVL